MADELGDEYLKRLKARAYVLASGDEDDDPRAGSDKIGKSEEKKFSRQEERTEELTEEFHRIFLRGLKYASYIIFVIFSVRVLHVIGPSWLTWLSESQINTIDHMLFSGTLGGLISHYLGSRIVNKPS